MAFLRGVRAFRTPVGFDRQRRQTGSPQSACAIVNVAVGERNLFAAGAAVEPTDLRRRLRASRGVGRPLRSDARQITQIEEQRELFVHNAGRQLLAQPERYLDLSSLTIRREELHYFTLLEIRGPIFVIDEKAELVALTIEFLKRQQHYFAFG